MVPKAASKSDINDLDDALPNALGPFIAIIESAEGLMNCEEIFSHGRVTMASLRALTPCYGGPCL